MSEVLPLVNCSIMASPGQKKGACGHIMASFDKHSRCARCREKGQGDDPCVQNLQCDFCSVLTPEQVLKLSTPTYKLRKEKAKAKEVLVDPSSVVVLDAQPEQEPAVSVSPAPDLSLPVPQFKKDLQELDEKWATRMARLEALITLGHRSSPVQNPTFSPVKVPVSHAAPAGALSQTPFFVSTSASSGPAGPAVGPDEPRDQDFSIADRQSPLQNLYPEAEPMFKHPAPVATVSSAAMSASSQAAFQQPSSGSGPVTFRDVNPQETFEEGELSDAEESPDLETSDPDRVLSEDQNYRETVRGVRAFMGWTHIPDLEFSPQSRTDNPWAGHRSQPYLLHLLSLHPAHYHKTLCVSGRKQQKSLHIFATSQRGLIAVLPRYRMPSKNNCISYKVNLRKASLLSKLKVHWMNFCIYLHLTRMSVSPWVNLYNTWQTLHLCRWQI